MASQAGVRAGLGAVPASDQVVPMAGLITALFDGREPLVDPAVRHRLHSLPEQCYWLLEELESLLEQAALASPVLVCIDDMHWADGGSLTALRTLPPRLAHLPIIWLVSFREGLKRIEAVSRRPELNEPVRELLASRLRTELLAALDRYDEALRLSTDGLDAGQRDHQGWAVREWEGGRGCRLLQVGRLAEAAAALDGVVAAMEKATPASSLDVQAAVASGRVAMHTGNEPQIRKCAAIARALLETGARLGQCACAWLLALIALWEGDAAAARTHLCALGEAERLTIVPLNPMDITDEVPLVRIAMAAGDGELAASAVATARERLRLNPAVASIAGTAAHAEGLITGGPDQLALAVKCFEQGPRPLALASALEDAGKVLAGRGDREEGVALLGQALELYFRAGASWDAARLRQRLRALGVRRRLAGMVPPRNGWSGLTECELEVVRQAARGLTNRQVAERLFLSQHTVSNHLRHAFAKLDITSRVELARLAAIHDNTVG